METLFNRIEEAGISIDKYHENDKLCGYELNTYTDGGVNQIIFIDFRDIDKNPENEEDFKELFLARVESIDIDDEIENNRQDPSYRQNFTLSLSIEDFTNWKKNLLELAENL